MKKILLAAVFTALISTGCGGTHKSGHTAQKYICHAEASDTVERVEIIAYPVGVAFTQPGIIVSC